MTRERGIPVGEFIAPLSLATDMGEISPRRLALLTAIAGTGSISGAARTVGMTYKAAWDAVDAMNNVAGAVLVQVQHGGRGGGGAQLSATGRKVVDDLARLQSLHGQFMAQLKAAGDLDESLMLMRRLSMKSSARNMLLGTVESLRDGGVSTEVNLRLTGGDSLHAIVTRESAQELGLAPGREVQAIIKASWIILAMGDDNIRTSARNRLCGSVTRIVEGDVNAEVVLALMGGNTLAVIITRQSLDELGLQEGSQVCALIKASHIILGVSL
ncbi:MAG: TOBE domain-containing protein [Pseudohongiella sp.]|uniref:TOBE domain-containing protein n=1 Tax=Pseudohongiella sp. TaxID=1979412 RepID=UPI0034A02D6F